MCIDLAWLNIPTQHVMAYLVLTLFFIFVGLPTIGSIFNRYGTYTQAFKSGATFVVVIGTFIAFVASVVWAITTLLN